MLLMLICLVCLINEHGGDDKLTWIGALTISERTVNNLRYEYVYSPQRRYADDIVHIAARHAHAIKQCRCMSLENMSFNRLARKDEVNGNNVNK